MDKRLVIVAGLVLGTADVAFAQARVIAFAAERLLPVGRAFTFDVITSVAGSLAYAWLVPNSLKPKPPEEKAEKAATPPPAPSPAPTFPPGNVPLWSPPASVPPLSPLLQACMSSSKCPAIDAELLKLDKGLGQGPRPALQPPPAPPDCSESGLDGSTALKRAVVLDRGTGFANRNAPAAMRCYYVAAQQNIPIAQFNLADMLTQGDDGVAPDRGLGLEYYEASASAGVLPAQLRLAETYEYDDGTPHALRRAGYWYTEAAHVGSAYAQYKLASFYYDGKGGVARNWTEAFRWLNLALKGGYRPARDTMEAFLDIVALDARDGIRGAQFVMGIAHEVGVPGFITADPRRAIWSYRRAGADRDLRRLCDLFPGDC